MRLKTWLAPLLALAALLIGGSADARTCHHGINRQCPRVCIASTADASGNSRTAYAIGVKPEAVTSPLAGSSLDGIDRDDQSSGYSAGVPGFGVSTSDGSMQVKATIRRGATGRTELIVTKDGVAPLSTRNWSLYIVSDKLNFQMVNSVGGVITAVGTTTLAANTNYVVQGDWNGSVLSASVNSVQEGTTPALTALQAPDATTPLTIGRFSWDSTDAGSPYPFLGTIADVSMTRGGVVQGQWAMTVLSCPGAANDDAYWPQLLKLTA